MLKIRPSKVLDFFLIRIKIKMIFYLIFLVEKDIKDRLKKFDISYNFINIINSETIVSDEETPLTAVKNSKNTSM